MQANTALLLPHPMIIQIAWQEEQPEQEEEEEDV